MKIVFGILFLAGLLCSCSVSRQVSRQANELLINDSAIASGHIGISVYEPAAGKFWYNYNADKNFIPSSNIKLFTLYAAMKRLGDSLVGVRYYDFGNNSMEILPTGDPTFLHPEFKNQPVYDFIKHSSANINFNGCYWKEERKGKGWAWDDYNSIFMTERSGFPIYGNLIKVFFKNDTLTSVPFVFGDIPFYTENWWETPNKLLPRLHRSNLPAKFLIKKLSEQYDAFGVYPSETEFRTTYIPMVIDGKKTIEILNDTIKPKNPVQYYLRSGGELPDVHTIHSQPTDSLLKPMMHRSDNFFAEQSLLMVSNETLGYMSDEAIIDSLLKTDLKDLPQQPRWVDGSGLSRYNLATPKSLVYLLQKIKNEFSWDRITTILPTGGEGTLKNYFKDETGFIYAKTGTLSNNCALSGYLVTKKNKLLIFSILNNNYATGATPVRRAVEKFLLQLREKY
ncbi:MAG: D-alanyl-D-alanine carboxypeptidase [Ferruginibacter sp.]